MRTSSIFTNTQRSHIIIAQKPQSINILNINYLSAILTSTSKYGVNLTEFKIRTTYSSSKDWPLAISDGQPLSLSHS
jgi:hypothetical protein